MTVSECAKLLGSKDGILLLTHKNPDGDTVMSAAALCRALRRKNKKAYLFRNTKITPKMLPFVDKLFAPESFVPKYVVSVDIATENLIPAGFDGKVDLAIDHHPSNSHFASAELIDAERSACGEIVQKLIVALTGKLTKTEATLLYIALTTDTGAFQYANTDEQTFLSAAELLHAGADAHAVMKARHGAGDPGDDAHRRSDGGRLRRSGGAFGKGGERADERDHPGTRGRKLQDFRPLGPRGQQSCSLLRLRRRRP